MYYMRVRGTILMYTSKFLNESLVKYKINFDCLSYWERNISLFGTLSKIPESSLWIFSYQIPETFDSQLQYLKCETLTVNV